MDEENPSLSSRLGSEGHQCDPVSGSRCKKDPSLWVVSTFPLTSALLRALEMHSKGYLFASCLKLSNNLLIKEDWKHSTSDLAVWGLQGPCCPQDSPWPPLLCSPGPLPAPGLRAQPQACRGSLWVTLGQSDLPEKEVGVPAIITGVAISAGLPRDGHDVYIHPVHRHCFSACCVPAGARAACWCVCPWAFSPAGPGAQRRLLLTEGGKEKRYCASSFRPREVAGAPAAIPLCPGLSLASPQPCWPSSAMERLIGGTFTTFSWDTRPLQLLVNPN